ncbi:MAG: glycosyltransferase family 4 protein [Salinivirgaceae bacterium]|nr:glycosyltransferase family 4 protein [Salinivirgaceae bacterium]
MNIINIVPGFGGTFYCGNCLRDSGYVSALKEYGHEAHTLPIYLPLSMDHVDREEGTPIFYGAISIYLKQNYKIFRGMPLWLEKFFNADVFLRYAAKKAGSTRAEGLEEMTISMLDGHDGYQKEELEQLIDYLKNHAKPDVIHLSNALLLGLAKKIKEDVGCAVICSLQDEDVWIDAMHPNYVDKVWNLMSEKAKDVDGFVAVSEYFGKLMQLKMQIPDEKMQIIYVGVEPELYTFKEPDVEHPTIGYLSRLNEENGFEIVIDAFIKLKQNPEHKNVKLKVTGGYTGDDVRFIKKQKRKLQRNNIREDVEFVNAYEGDKKKEFLSSLTLLTVPVLNGEAFGLYQLEALASGTPTVQPKLGAFPEIVEATKGGVIFEPNTSEALAEKLHEVLSNKKRIIEMASAGRKSVEEKFNMKQLIQKMIKGYETAMEDGERRNKIK